MGIRGMNWNEWIELDRDFPQVHKVVEYRIRTAGERLVQVRDAQPGAVSSGHPAGEYCAAKPGCFDVHVHELIVSPQLESLCTSSPSTSPGVIRTYTV